MATFTGIRSPVSPDPEHGHLDTVAASLAESRRAEARAWAAMLAHQDDQEHRFAADGLTGEALAVARSTVPGQIATRIAASEQSISGILHTARKTRRDLPTTWQAFRAGSLSQQAVRRIYDAACELTDPAHLDDLDTQVVPVAVQATPPKLSRWLTRFVGRHTTDSSREQQKQAKEDRNVRVTHLEHGMSLVEAYLPTVTAAAIRRRLSAVARASHAPIPHQNEDGSTLVAEATEADGDDATAPGTPESRAAGDPRTLAQREADLFATWLLSGRIDGTEVDAKIAVMIPAATLSGESDAPGISADRSYTIPAEDARRLAARGVPGHGTAQHDWYQVTYRPLPTRSGSSTHRDGLGPTGAEADVLSIVYTGYSPPQRLRDALIFRDGTCQAPGCTVDAQHCDLDHQIPHPDGPTTAGNLWALCRRHHRMKSHGYLSPPGRPYPPDDVLVAPPRKKSPLTETSVI